MPRQTPREAPFRLVYGFRHLNMPKPTTLDKLKRCAKIALELPSDLALTSIECSYLDAGQRKIVHDQMVWLLVRRDVRIVIIQVLDAIPSSTVVADATDSGNLENLMALDDPDPVPCAAGVELRF